MMTASDGQLSDADRLALCLAPFVDLLGANRAALMDHADCLSHVLHQTCVIVGTIASPQVKTVTLTEPVLFSSVSVLLFRRSMRFLAAQHILPASSWLLSEANADVSTLLHAVSSLFGIKSAQKSFLSWSASDMASFLDRLPALLDLLIQSARAYENCAYYSAVLAFAKATGLMSPFMRSSFLTDVPWNFSKIAASDLVHSQLFFPPFFDKLLPDSLVSSSDAANRPSFQESHHHHQGPPHPPPPSLFLQYLCPLQQRGIVGEFVIVE